MNNVLVAAREIFLWAAESLIMDASAFDAEYVTDVFRKDSKPKNRSLVVAVGDSAHGAVLAPDHAPWIVGLAQVHRTSGVARGKVRTRFEPWVTIVPIPLREALTRALGDRAETVGIPGPLRAVRLTGSEGARLLDVLREHDEQIGPWLEELRRPQPTKTDLQLQSRAETRDAVDLASDIANVAVSNSAYVKQPDIRAATLLESVLKSAHRADLEEDLLPEDLRRFDGLMNLKQASASVAHFRSRDFQLTVFNVNKKPVDVILGVDLIYWDVTHDVFTLIQYKRLERQRDRPGVPGTWAYHRRGEITKQLRLMPDVKTNPTTSLDWRMTQTPFWFKFVKGDAARHQDGILLRGMYVPADYLRLAIDDGSLQTGPKGGFRVDYENTRYLDRASFIRLVRQGLVGTNRAQSADLHKVIEDLTSFGRSVVLAVKTKWSKQARRVGRHQRIAK